MPSCAQVSRSVRALTSALTISPACYLPGQLAVDDFERISSGEIEAKAGLQLFGENAKPPETTKVFRPAAFAPASIFSAPGDRRSRSS